jgi:CBS domain containing-hemolysin-like protein
VLALDQHWHTRGSGRVPLTFQRRMFLKWSFSKWDIWIFKYGSIGLYTYRCALYTLIVSVIYIIAPRSFFVKFSSTFTCTIMKKRKLFRYVTRSSTIVVNKHARVSPRPFGSTSQNNGTEYEQKRTYQRGAQLSIWFKSICHLWLILGRTMACKNGRSGRVMI